MWEDFAPNFGDKITGYCITTKHRLTLPFSPRIFFTKNNMTVVPQPHYFSVSPIEEKTLRPPFWPQLRWSRQNRRRWTYSQKDFQCSFKNGRSAGKGVYTRTGTISAVMVASRSKVCLRWDGGTNPGNYGWFFVHDFGRSILYFITVHPSPNSYQFLHYFNRLHATNTSTTQHEERPITMG
jgi:hypothetical protein